MMDTPSDSPYEYAPPPIPAWGLRRPLVALWYIASRVGDHGRLAPFRRLTRITSRIYLGGQINARGWRLMQSWGVQALVNLRVEWDDRWSGIQSPYYLWLPTIDSTNPVLEQLLQGTAFIHEQVQAGRQVYVHCAAGLGRSPTLVVAYLVARGFTAEKAVEFILARRPFIALSKRQEQAVGHFERYIAQRGIDYAADALKDPLEPAR
jgi:atypical dual specificity phosphatase